MDDSSQKSIFLKIFGVILFTLMSIGAIYYFQLLFFTMLKEISANAESIIFNRGIYFLPGIAFCLMALIFISLFETFTHNTLSDKMNIYFARIAISGLFFIFLLPISAEYITERHLHKKGYSYCDMPSSSWAMYKSIYYAINENVCTLLNEKNKQNSPALYPKEDNEVYRHY